MPQIIQIETIDEVNEYFNAEVGIVVDLRSQADFEKEHLERAVHLDLMSTDFIDYFSLLKKDKKVLLYCADGSRSKVAVRILREMGFEHLYNLTYGIKH